jgi:hypothetical protein
LAADMAFIAGMPVISTRESKLKKTLLCAVVALICVSPGVNAQAYKCKQANGSLSFQDHPCQVGATGSTYVLPPTPPTADDSAGNSVPPRGTRATHPKTHPEAGQSWAEQENDRKRAEEQAKITAYNKMQRCNFARQQLGVLKEARPVFHRDDAGNRNYMEDKDRAGAIAAAERRVATECQ